MEPLPFSPSIRYSYQVEDDPEEQQNCNVQLQFLRLAVQLHVETQGFPRRSEEAERFLDRDALSLPALLQQGYRPTILSREGRIQEALFAAWSDLYMRSIAINLRLLKYADWRVMSYRVSKSDAPEKRVQLLGTVHIGSRFLEDAYEDNYLRKARTILALCKRLFLERDPLQAARERGWSPSQANQFLFHPSASIPGTFSPVFFEKYFSEEEVEEGALSFCATFGIEWKLAQCAARLGKEILSLDPESRGKSPSVLMQPKEQRQKDFERLGDMSMCCDVIASLALRQHYTKFYSRSSLQSNLQREKLYLAKIDTLLTDEIEGDSMVAVGLAHVERAGSLVSRLLEKGYTVEQVPLRA